MLNYISFNYVGPGAIEFVPHLPKNKHKEKMENDLQICTPYIVIMLPN